MGCLTDDTCIANKFADIFANTCKPNVSSKDKLGAEKEAFMNMLVHYKGALFILEDVIDVEHVQSAVNDFSNGKAAGYDLLTAEYLKYCHPIALSYLTELFSVMFWFSYVPNAFEIGITVPL